MPSGEGEEFVEVIGVIEAEAECKRDGGGIVVDASAEVEH